MDERRVARRVMAWSTAAVAPALVLAAAQAAPARAETRSSAKLRVKRVPA